MKLEELKIPKINLKPLAHISGIQTRLSFQYDDIVRNTEIGQKVLQILNDDPRVISLNGKMISFGGGAGQFAVDNLAKWYVWCADKYGQKDALFYLNSFLDSDIIEVVNTLWVLGIEVDESISLLDGYTVQSVKDMPDSYDKEYFLNRSSGFIAQRSPLPACAITKLCHVNKAWGHDPPVSTVSIDKFHDVTRRLNEIALLLNAVSGVSCLPYYSTSYSNTTTPLGLFTSASGGGSSLYDVIGYRMTWLSGESKSTIDALINAFEGLLVLEKKRIQRILHRLSQAKRREQIEDKILDLGITLEMLLLDDNKKNDQLALSFRLRGSWLLGNSARNRVKICDQLKKIYDYRSQVAHSGVLCKGNAERIASVRELFPEFQSLAEDICQKIIIDGTPDWNKVVLDAIE